MGITFIEGTVRGVTGTEASVRFLVDSGATYSLLPPLIWQSIGLEAKRSQQFSLADGTLVERRISECYVIWEQREPIPPLFSENPMTEH